MGVALVVEPRHLANRFKDATLPPVLATPVMIMAMENAALNVLKPYLEPGASALGTAVDVRHKRLSVGCDLPAGYFFCMGRGGRRCGGRCCC